MLQNRCDGIADCEDYSDEKNCTMIVTDEQLYRKGTAPYGFHEEDTKVKIDVTILNIGSINEFEQILTIKFFIHIEW